MKSEPHHKVTARHLTRSAYLYVRQSTLHQVSDHTESTRRQYDLSGRARTLGWGEEQIVVVDSDQGQSGSTADRIGFQKLVSEVGLGHAGLVMGLEVSRLARNSADWHRLLEICALTDTLILDEDGLYNPAHFNDRLLLGLKGTMSEAELHILRARLQGGLLNKARRGKLNIPLPVGFVYDEQSRVTLDPDVQVQEAIRTLFATFPRVGSAVGTAKVFRKEKILFPCRQPVWGPQKNTPVEWKDLTVTTVLRLLHNPRYAGIYCYGATRQYRTPEGRQVRQKRSPEEWCAWIPGAHEGYISQQEYEENQRRLAENGRALGADRRSPPREGPALLQGIVVCGKCGNKMGVHYHWRQEELVPGYVCVPRKEEPRCQTVHGKSVDEAVGELLVELMTPMSLEVSLSVQQELAQRFEQAERLRRKQVDRARYEADLARRRFLQVDPDNRLVAASLEAEWNEKLRSLLAAEEEFERRVAEDRKPLDDEHKAKVRSLASDFSRLWNDPQTPARERKRMARLLVEDVTIRRGDEITAHVRFKGGATKTLTLPLPLNAVELSKTDPEIIRKIDQLLDHHNVGEIANQLNDKGFRPSRGQSFHAALVQSLCVAYKLKSRYRRLCDAGHLTATELAAKLHVGHEALKRWEHHGLLKAYYYTEKRWRYEDPTLNSSLTAEEVRDRLRAACRDLERTSE